MSALTTLTTWPAIATHRLPDGSRAGRTKVSGWLKDGLLTASYNAAGQIEIFAQELDAVAELWRLGRAAAVDRHLAKRGGMARAIQLAGCLLVAADWRDRGRELPAGQFWPAAAERHLAKRASDAQLCLDLELRAPLPLSGPFGLRAVEVERRAM